LPRRKKLPEESIQLWLTELPLWKRRVLQVIASAQKPLTTSEILRAIDYEARENILYNWLQRLEQRGLVGSLKVFMSNKRAWRFREEYKSLITQALGAQA